MDHSPFARLPPELRHEIYAHLFRGTHCNLQIYRAYNYVSRAYPNANFAALSRQRPQQTKEQHTGPLPLLLTCRTLYHEVQDALYALTTFQLQLHLRHLPFAQITEPSEHNHKVLDSQEQDSSQKDRQMSKGMALKLPPAMLCFLRNARIMNLDIWLCAASTSAEFSAQLAAFLSLLATQPQFVSLSVRFRLRPQWMENDPHIARAKEFRPGYGPADTIVRAVKALPCCSARTPQVRVHKEVVQMGLVSQELVDEIQAAW